MELKFEMTYQHETNLGVDEFDVLPDKEDVTVGEVIDWILENRKQEWGTIAYSTGKRFEYAYGKIVKGERDDFYDKKKLIKAYSMGTYSLMDYSLI